MNSVAAGYRLCDADYEIRELYQLNENLGHVVIERNDSAARNGAGINAYCADIYQCDYREVYEHEGCGVHESGYPADRRLHLGQGVVLRVKVRNFLFLFAERSDNAGTEQVFARLAQ